MGVVTPPWSGHRLHKVVSVGGIVVIISGFFIAWIRCREKIRINIQLVKPSPSNYEKVTHRPLASIGEDDHLPSGGTSATLLQKREKLTESLSLEETYFFLETIKMLKHLSLNIVMYRYVFTIVP